MDGLYPAAQVWVGSSYVQVFFIQASVRSARHLCPCWLETGEQLKMSEMLNNIIKGLVLYYLHQGTVQSAVEQGQEAGLPTELLESLPGMMLEITSAAGAVFDGARTFDDVVDEIVERVSATEDEQNAARMNIQKLMQMALDFIKKLAAEHGTDSPLPEMRVPWYKYENANYQ